MPSYTLNIRREVQRDTLLCWAAVSVMAIRSFPERGGFRHASQEDVVAYERIRKRKLLPEGDEEPPELIRARKAFERGRANAAGSPWLLGLDRTRVKSISKDQPRMLSKAHFFKEIHDRKRPVLIRWVYGSVHQPPGKRRGAHELIVTGYNDETHEIRIWDPWPAANMPDTAPAQRERWIPYSRYANPVSDQGVKVSAQHQFDEFALRLMGEKSVRYPKLVKVPVKARGDDTDSDVDEGAGGFDLRKPIKKHMKGHIVRRRGGARVRGPFTTGDPIPVLPVTVGQLLRRKRRPASLLATRCRTVVIPILKNRRVVDSFLLTRGSSGWRDGGYSNNEIASRVAQWRRQNARHPSCKGKDFFLLSIPEHGTFFLANGYGEQANLISLQNGKGGFEPADRALKTVIRKITTTAKNRNRKPTGARYKPK